MRSDYDVLYEGLGERERKALEQAPGDLAARLKSGEALLDSNLDLLVAAAEFFASSVARMPCTGRLAIKRIADFLEAARAKGPEHCAGAKAVEEFKAKFKPPEPAGQARLSPPDPHMERDARKILQQALFRDFFAMVDKGRRERLIKFMESHNLCDKEILKELRERIDRERNGGDAQAEALLLQVERGAMDCFPWLHQMLFNFFNGVAEAEDRGVDLERQLKEACGKGAPPAPEAAAEAELRPNGKTPQQSPQEAKAEPHRESLGIELEKLRNELAAKDAFLAVKMDSEMAKLETERFKFVSECERRIAAADAEKQALEGSNARQAEEFARRSKLSAHVFETFLDTLPPDYAAPGYGMLKSIVNEWDGDLQSVQEKSRKYTPPQRREEPQKKRRDAGWILVCICVVITLLTLVAAICFGTRKERPREASQTVTESCAPADLSRLASLRLETAEDINRAFATIERPTPTETAFLTKRLAELTQRRQEEAAK